MRILADENIPYVREAFGGLGDVATLHGREISRDAVRDADLLLVRSITKVDGALLEGSRVRFVATATIGEDHIDKAWLAEHGIAFASAPGSNAGSVAQYVTAALLALADKYKLALPGMKLGIVGVGNVGSRVRKVAMALGMRPVLNDPPLARAIVVQASRLHSSNTSAGTLASQERAGGTPAPQKSAGAPAPQKSAETPAPQFSPEDFRPLDEIFDCDIVTLHVPLTRQGIDRTYHLVDGPFLSRLRRGAILINTSRGAVADGFEVKSALDEGLLKACVLDVWEGEPGIDVSLLERVFIGTPHIAGYSFDGKVNGTRMIYEAACRFLAREPSWNPAPLLPAPEHPRVEVDSTAADALHSTVRAVYDIMKDDAAMRGLPAAQPEDRAKLFDRLRKEYPRRREFFNTAAVVRPRNTELETRLAGLGFQIEDIVR